MSAQSFALTSPSVTDVTDSIALAEARARYYDAERQGDAALAAWARAYAPPLLNFAEDYEPEEDEDAITGEDLADAKEEGRTAQAEGVARIIDKYQSYLDDLNDQSMTDMVDEILAVGEPA